MRQQTTERASRVRVDNAKSNTLDFLRRGTAVVFSLIFIFTLTGMQIPDQTASADGPDGATKRVIVRYNRVLGSSTEDPAEAENLSGYIEKERILNHVPYGVYEVDAEGEASLRASGQVVSVFEDRMMEWLADTPLPSIGANPTNISFSDTNTSVKYDGDGYAVAVIDTGVDKNHPGLSGKVISEACFGVNQGVISSLCPGAATFSNSTNSGLDCVIDACGHGTMVASAAAMPALLADIDGDSSNDLLGGSAQNAKIVAIKVASQVTGSGICAPYSSPCAMPFASSIIYAADYVIDLSLGTPIAAMNISIGGGNAATSHAQCRAEDPALYDIYAEIFSALRGKGIAPVVSNGNNGAEPGQENGIHSAACVEGAVAVGATNVVGDEIASYSNNGGLTTLLAPGGDYDNVNDDSLLWYPKAGTSGLGATQGTSFAAPIVAGAYAVLREKHPNASVDQLTQLFQSTGVNIADGRSGYTVGAKKQINITAALTASTVPEVNLFTGPVGVVHEGGDTVLSVDVDEAETCSLDNGIGSINHASGSVTVPGFEEYELTCVGLYGDEETASFSAASFNTRPTQPSGGAEMTVVTDVAARKATVSWTASTDPDDIEEYEVYLDSQLIGSTSGTTYTLTDLGLNHEYALSVYAVDSLGGRSLPTSQVVVLGANTTPGVPSTGLFNILAGMNTAVLFSIVAAVSSSMALILGRKIVRFKK